MTATFFANKTFFFRFSGLTSLQDHVNRRVIVLKYNCSGCSNEILTFYNRCSFLLHTRNHFSLNGGTINMKEIDTFPLPISLTGFLPHPNIPFIYESEEEILNDNIFINAQFYSPDSTEKGREIITLKPSDLIFRQNGELLALKQVCRNVPKCVFITVEEQKLLKKHLLTVEESNISNNNNANSSIETDIQIKEEVSEEYTEQMTMPIIAKVESLQDQTLQLPMCLECGKFQSGAIAEHYIGNSKPTDVSLTCSDCKLIASTACSLKAHMRIHSQEPPHVCPDCGKDFDSWSALKNHLDTVCFHLSKLIRYRCPGKRCGKLFATTVTFASHFKVHLKKLYVCSECNVILVNEESIEIHKHLHNQQCNFTKLYDCTLCSNTEALTEENFEEHIAFHTTDTGRSMYVFICKSCKSYFRSTTTFAAHLLKCHGKKHPSEVKSGRSYTSKYVTKDCELCQNKIIFNVEKPVTMCNKCVQQKQNDERLNKMAAKVTKRYYCILCNKHILVDEKISHMKQCKYGRAFVSIARINTEESSNISHSSSSSETSLISNKSPAKRFRSEVEDQMRKKKKRIYIPNYRNRKPEVQLDLTAEEPVPFNGTYSCKLCDYTNTKRKNFHEHIKRHRDISTAYQCMECGECFVVKPSLHKHLLHFHNISDYETYLGNNDCYDIDAVKELEEIMNLAPGESKEPVKENQCRVCLQEFDDSITMNKHYRIHGMAFLLKNSK